MSPGRSYSDPRRPGGGIAGPGGPHDQGGVVIDTRRAVLLETTTVAKVDNPSDGRTFVALELEGRINRSSERADILYLFDADGAAAIVTELLGFMKRAGGELEAEFMRRFDERAEKMP
jgi:hypothetical protein